MAKKIKWSERARRDRFEILTYWTNRNKSKEYSKKLNQLFLDSVYVIAKFPYSGKPTQITDVRMKIVRDYFVFYNIQQSFIEIITIRDSRRDPKKFKL